ncbi:alpha-L-rhamnosidase [Sphingomonas sp. GC_Shp_3]|uniref:MGH1-like glycoside hydrolase domain-containing protein n=1 Tax=Sphingomonas sp. GC_Shp_3 TaxID=2937383 RepID=UPI00226AC8CE|nr:alpha-L-rhamnosidase [Sphingomonas sp. GC_Shp_3]
MIVGRRPFLAGAAAAIALPATARAAPAASSAPVFTTSNARWQNAYDKALAVLAGNVRVLPYIPSPVLIEGSVYNGIWQECGPHEALVYRHWRPDVARASHLTFFALQRADGQLPANNKLTETGFGQIQMVVPIAATAWELAHATGDAELLEASYRACSAWDGWLMRYRNTRGTGLVEGFCTYDTGHDNSPRWQGVPDQCPNKEAKRYPAGFGLPRLCPDLSATVYGGRRALAAMARALGRNAKADSWTEQAEAIRRLILTRLYVAEDAAFYDLDAADRFVRVRGDILTRVAGEHVVDQAVFDAMWQRQLGNPKAFWSPFPFPSIALDDPSFVRPIPRNSWGGAAQALTALRTGRWMDHYHRSAEHGTLMNRWCEAIQQDPSFRQQIDPQTGAFTQEDAPNYSPAALVMVDFTWRLVGVQQVGGELHWNCRPAHPAARGARAVLRTDQGQVATLAYEGGGATLTLGGTRVARIDGGHARLVTDTAGRLLRLTGIEAETQQPMVTLMNRSPRRFALARNADVPLPA